MSLQKVAPAMLFVAILGLTLSPDAPGGAAEPVSAQRAKDAPPRQYYWDVWTDERGVTHQTRCELTEFHMESMGGRAAPQWNDHLVTSDATVLLATLPVGWIGDWHSNPKPQWIIPLSGRWFVETMDGVRVEMGPGDISFGADQNAKTDAQGRAGHRSGTVGDVPAVMMIVQLNDKAWIAARPCIFR
ncbi:MAG: hypothetical protein R3D62_18850, partial [Xanthobacteraceae bacterium]